jgi:ABC-type multidrug transport system ATPase subunit
MCACVTQDEPTSGLDSNGATDLVQLLKVRARLTCALFL